MKILVVGAGATGGYFGARLAQAGHEVAFLVREGRAQQLADEGLVVKGFHDTVNLTPTLLTAETLTDNAWQLIILAVKHPHLAQVIEQIRPAVSDKTYILPLLNGMDHIAALQHQYGDRVLGGLCQIYATLNAKNEIEQLTSLHRISFGALFPAQQKGVMALAQQLEGVVFTLQVSDDITSEMWEKYLFLSTLGAVTCLARADTQRILSTPGGAQYIETLFNEVLTIIEAAGYQPRTKVINQLLKTLLNTETPLVSSLYRDVMAGNVSESRAIVGALVERAAVTQQPIPVLQACWVQLQLVNGRMA
ncbi:ketopantoate reductase family protein [Rosenbergiella nectarea]|uniref:ketopantoate reductase family protein n=1 Tax=Rosenbergiella nectarea TaxID=988801 RepID=UPI001BDA3543|nr:ketopantoate reductase family protein [Rosenbergiella nectarea]MBT0731353.1 ketopantoate reductase family protein [Rosenbergiella nectarea subsp. apis]